MKATSINGLYYIPLERTYLTNHANVHYIYYIIIVNYPGYKAMPSSICHHSMALHSQELSPQIACFNTSRCVTAPKSIQLSWNMGEDEGNMANGSSEIQKSGKILQHAVSLIRVWYEWRHLSERAELPHFCYPVEFSIDNSHGQS